ncbi:MAG: hypothetical protein MUF34_01030 [Polyangiaceae bacterium]|nr:hypothetical protein [Polyangiaceae bacterium]
MKNRMPLWLTPLLAGTLVACGGTVRVVSVAPASGELALQGDRSEAQAQAKSFIGQHCPTGHDVVHDGVTVVGTRPESNTTAYGRHFDAPPTDLVEWRIRYRCLIGASPSLASFAAEDATPAREPAPPRPEPSPAVEPAPPPAAPSPPAALQAPPPNNWF